MKRSSLYFDIWQTISKFSSFSAYTCVHFNIMNKKLWHRTKRPTNIMFYDSICCAAHPISCIYYFNVLPITISYNEFLIHIFWSGSRSFANWLLLRMTNANIFQAFEKQWLYRIVQITGHYNLIELIMQYDTLTHTNYIMGKFIKGKKTEGLMKDFYAVMTKKLCSQLE